MKIANRSAVLLAAIGLSTGAVPATLAAQAPVPRATANWVDLADLAAAADLVVHARIRKQAELKPERARGVAPGRTRLYIEAETVSLIAGNVPVGQALRYLVDVPLDAKGRAPKLKKQDVVLFARPVAGRPGEVQLVTRDAQLPWTPALEGELRPILSALIAPGAPPRIAGIRDALSVEGNLQGESETQIFLDTPARDPVAISVVRRPGRAPVWGVSYSEIVDQAVRAPQPRTLGWYRLACFLPPSLPGEANLSREPASRARAAEDYGFVMQQLGTCDRLRVPPGAGQ